MPLNYKLYLFGLIAILLLTYFVHQPKRTFSKEEGEEYARKRIHEVLTDTVFKEYYEQLYQKQVLIDNEATAIKIAEPILFRKYGKETILNERPYQAFKFNNHWLIKGSFPDNPDLRGGTFEIIIDSKDARVIRMVHYK